MPPNPLTPPIAGPAEVADTDNNGVTFAVASSCPNLPGSISHLSAVIQSDHSYDIATPTSMGIEGLEERSATEDRSDFNSVTDEDQDMSEGGVPLSTCSSHDGTSILENSISLSHAEQLNAELDMLDAEIMGMENMDGMFMDSVDFQIYHSPEHDDLPFYYSDSIFGPDHGVQPTGDASNEMTYDTFSQGFQEAPTNTADLPGAMSDLSQQLQHLQDGQENVELANVPDTQHDAFTNHSISPSSFPHMSSANVEILLDPPQEAFISLAEISSLTSATGPTMGVHNTAHPGGQNQPNADVLMSNHFASSVVWDDDLGSEADQVEVDDQYNLSLVDFLYTWGRTSARADDEPGRRTVRGPALPAILRQRDLEDIQPLERSGLQGERCDIQRINWTELGVSRLEARQMRRQTYKNYTNLRLPVQWHPRLNGARLLDDENYFKFRRMDFDHEIHLSHFQLRNLMACDSRDHIFYAGKSKIMQYTPTRGTNPTVPASTVLDVTNPEVQPHFGFSSGIQISTMTVAHDVLIAGGFCGEYAVLNLKADKHTRHTEGLIVDYHNSITNHVQVHLSRTSSLPQAAFSSNDNGLRVLDINTNRFIAEHKYEHAVNASAISPDQRLRVLVGDTQSVMICNAETGEVLQQLEGHRDFGFACDWADDGWTVATGNQDMQVKIWDARKWKDTQGLASPLATIAAEMAGVRNLKFSPVGSGRRILVAAEPADFVSIINAQTFSSKQTLSFFGEIGGMDFTNGGQDLFLGNCDNMRGGIMEFEKCGVADEALSGLGGEDGLKSRARDIASNYGYDWDSSDESTLCNPKSQGTITQRRRKPALLGTTMPPF